MGRKCPASHSHSKTLAPQCSALPSVPSPSLRALPLSSAGVGGCPQSTRPWGQACSMHTYQLCSQPRGQGGQEAGAAMLWRKGKAQASSLPWALELQASSPWLREVPTWVSDWFLTPHIQNGTCGSSPTGSTFLVPSGAAPPTQPVT